MANQYTATRKPIQIPLPIEGAIVEIELTKGYAAIVDVVDADLAQYHWCSSVDKNGVYAQRRLNQKKVKLHCVILERMLERQLKKGEEVDHVNRNPLDNRRCNLRLATRTQNVRNQKRSKPNKAGYKGVRLDRNRWQARISVNNKLIHLGMFDSPEEAYAAYCEAAKKYHGEFAQFD